MGKQAEKIEVEPNKRGEWFWRYRAGNGETVCVSEAFASSSATSPASRSRRMAVTAAKRMGKRLGVRVVALPSGTRYAKTFAVSDYAEV